MPNENKIKEDKTKETEESDFNNWPSEKQKDFFDILALGARRYGGGGHCLVIPADHQ